MTSQLEIVPVDPSDAAVLGAWVSAASSVFLAPRPDAEAVAFRQRRFADHRLWAGRDAGATVATFRSFDTDLTLPGVDPALVVNAISSVSVLPTHRRRGLLTRWLTDELERARDARSPASILIASEAPIYGRFGFGAATTACRWTVDARATFTTSPTGSVQLVDGETFVAAAAETYPRARRRHPGAIDRTLLHWQVAAQTVPVPGDDDRRRQLLVHRDPDGAVDGLCIYSVRSEWTDRVSASVLEVADLWAASDGAYADLWRCCCSVDFVREVRAEDRSPREPLPLLLSDPRAARDGATSDFLWVRLHDVPAALSARRYPLPGTLTLQVADALGQVEGGYRLEVAADGSARCTREPQPDPDVRLDAAALASLWLGSGDADALHRTGRLLPRDPAALARVDALLGWPVPAWCGTWF